MKKPNTVYECMQLFTENRPYYEPMVKDFKHMKDLITKLNNLHKKTNGEEPTHEETLANFQIIMSNLPAWWQDKSIPVIHGGINTWLPDTIRNIAQSYNDVGTL